MAFTAWWSFAHAAFTAVQAFPNLIARGELIGSALLVVIGVALIALFQQSRVLRKPLRGGGIRWHSLNLSTEGILSRDHWSHHSHRHRRHGLSHDAVSQAMAREDQYRRHEPDHQPVCRMASGFRYSHARGSKVRKRLSNPSERVSSVERFHHRSYLQQSIRVGEERPRGRRLRTQNLRQEISPFRAESRA